jgi:hypothetical protein
MTSLDALVVDFKLDCAARQSAHQHFRMSIQALTPMQTLAAHAELWGASSRTPVVR